MKIRSSDPLAARASSSSIRPPRKVRTCQSDHPDFDHCVRVDGSACPEGECDLENGVLEPGKFPAPPIPRVTGPAELEHRARMLGNSEVLMGQAPLFELPLERVVTVAFRIPYPPSVNTIYRHRVMGKKVVTYKTPEHRTYVDAVGSSVRYAGLRNPMIDTLPFVGNVSLIVRLFRPRKAGDIDNRMKALFDSLNGVAWKDDSQVVELHVYRREDKDDPRAELEIEGVP